MVESASVLELPMRSSFACLCSIFELEGYRKKVLGDAAVEFNEMSSCITLGRAPLGDDDVSEVRRRVETCFKDRKGNGLEFRDSDVWKALSLTARTRPYHPVREYLRKLEWDKTPRLEHVPDEVLGAEGSPIQRAIFRRFMVSACARAELPGFSKVDTMPVLFGAQGARKSTFWRVLAVKPEWFSDTAIDLRGKDSFLQVRGVWIYEWAELHAMNSASLNLVKGFITSQWDRFRPPYGRATIDVGRGCVFVGSTNTEEFLSDPTGERRFWPLRVGPSVDVEKLHEWRDQLWAEAYALWKAKEQWYLNEGERTELTAVHEQHRERDAWEPVVEDWIATLLDKEFVSTEQVLEIALQKHRSTWNDQDKKRLARVMRALGYRNGRQRPDAYANPKRGWLRFSD